MDILLKLLAVGLWLTAVIAGVMVLDQIVSRWSDPRRRLVARTCLYAAAFTPTVYHHAPNTIVAPLHLPTICGNLFYPYEYSLGMFYYRVALPVVFGWMGLMVAISLQRLFRCAPSSVGHTGG